MLPAAAAPGLVLASAVPQPVPSHYATASAVAAVAAEQVLH